MDVESHRRKHVKNFIECLNITYCSKIKTFFEEMVVEVSEDLKLVEDEEWEDLYEAVSWSKIKLRNFKAALCELKSIGAVNSSMNKPLPVTWDENEGKHNVTLKP